MLTENMKKLISQHTLGFVASVDETGQPNLSPKGTFVIVDDKHLMFSEIRSPNTIRNIQINPQVEVNFVDPFKRKGVRIKGICRIIEKPDAEFERLFDEFEQWGELTRLIRRIVMIDITDAKEISSPIYDIGADENEMVSVWSEKYRQMYE